VNTSNDDKQPLQRIAQLAVDRATRLGVKEVRAVADRSRHVAMTYRDGKPDTVEEALSRGLTIDLFVDGRYTKCRTNDLREAALERFVADAAELCRATSSDACRALPEPQLYADRTDCDLKDFDPSVDRLKAEDRHEKAAVLEAATVDAAGPKLVSVEASYADVLHEFHQIQSNGFEGSRQTTRFWTWASVTLQDAGERRPQGWAEAGARFYGELADSGHVARETVDFARARLATSKIATQKLPMIVHNRAAGRLLGYLVRAAGGGALHRKTSFLTDCLGKRIGSDRFTLRDSPLIAGGFGSRPFDREGMTARPIPIVEDGILKNFFLDTYYARKLKMSPTTGGSSNLLIPPGDKSLENLTTGVERGVLVRGFIGGNCNLTTGDFSLGVFGTLIERGQLTRGVAEVNISGNLQDLWNRLTDVGNDSYPYSTYRIPSLLFEEVQFSGE
jgi:PmbA protein